MFGSSFLRSFSNLDVQGSNATIYSQGEAEVKEELVFAEDLEDLTPGDCTPSDFTSLEEIATKKACTSTLGTTGKSPRKTSDRENRFAEQNGLMNRLFATEKNVDEMDLFFQSIASSAKKLPLHLQHRLKKLTLDTLCNLEEENSQETHFRRTAAAHTRQS